MMQQAFWFGFDLENLLFYGVNIHSVGGLIWLCIGLIVLTVSFEGLKVLQVRAKVHSLLLGKSSSLTRISDDEPFVNSSHSNHRRRFSWFLVEVGLYVVQIISGYMIMLVVMTYNVYIALSVLFGASAGYAVFGAILMAHRIQNAKLVAPCQQCINTHRDDSPQTTILEDEGGCCSRNNEGEPVIPALVQSVKNNLNEDNPSTSVIVHHSYHQAIPSHKAEEKSLLTPD